MRGAASPCISSFPARGASGERLVVHLIPASESAREAFEGGFGVLVVTTVSAPAQTHPALIQGLFDLSAAEARVACGIAGGLTVQEMADRHRVGRETVHSQVNAVLAKTGTRRQVEVAAMLAAIPAFGRPE
jgi:DNA-binding CsgD family transcriptional regulator